MKRTPIKIGDNPTMTILPVSHKFRRENKFSMPMLEFINWNKIDEVNKRLDSGEAILSVYAWVKEEGYNISRTIFEKYAGMRKKSLVDNISIQHQMSIVKPIIDITDVSTKTSSDKLKSEIDALDLIIQGGYNTLKKFADKPILPNTLMAAIKLKNDLTGGNHGFLTNYGMEYLRDVESTKFNLIIQHLIEYIPESIREEAISKIADIEEKYYKTTEYYEEYLRALGTLSEGQIQYKLKSWKEDMKAGKILGTIKGHS